MRVSKKVLLSIRPSFIKRFTENKPDVCWPWQGGRHKQRGGYGYLSVRINNKVKSLLAHRLALAYALGRWPDPTVFACHTCDNPSCVNPSHIYAGCSKSNVEDMYARGRARPRSKGCRGPCRQLSSDDAKAALHLYFGKEGQGSIKLLRLSPQKITFLSLMNHFSLSATTLRRWLHLSGTDIEYQSKQAQEARSLWFSRGSQGYYAKPGSRNAKWSVAAIAKQYSCSTHTIKQLVAGRFYPEAWKKFLGERPQLKKYMKARMSVPYHVGINT